MRVLAAMLLLAGTAAANGDHGEDRVPFDSGMLAPGATFTHTFDEPGSYAYHCHPHPWMVGTVEVGPAQGEPQTHQVSIVEGANSNAWGYEPADLAIRAGDSVEWTNDGQAHHTVTAKEADTEAQESPLPAGLALLGLAVALRRR